MRNYLFRGKRLDNGEWVEGSLVYLDSIDKHRIVERDTPTNTAYEVDPETVGQDTGLLDKNGKKVWEGDVLATGNSDPSYDQWSKEDYGYTVVEEMDWEGCMFSSWIPDADQNLESIYGTRFIEVIGNRWDNPDLLQGGGDE